MFIAAVGMAGSGKSVFCDHLWKRGWPIVYFGGLVLSELDRRGLARTQENEKAVREDLRQKLGMDAIAQLALPPLRAYAAKGENCAIDGIYSFSEYKALKREFGKDLVVVAIITPRGLRYERLSGRPVRPLSAEEAEARDYAEVERIEKGGPIALADHYILNDGPPEQLHAAVDALIVSILGEKAAA